MKPGHGQPVKGRWERCRPAVRAVSTTPPVALPIPDVTTPTPVPSKPTASAVKVPERGGPSSLPPRYPPIVIHLPPRVVIEQPTINNPPEPVKESGWEPSLHQLLAAVLIGLGGMGGILIAGHPGPPPGRT